MRTQSFLWQLVAGARYSGSGSLDRLPQLVPAAFRGTPHAAALEVGEVDGRLERGARLENVC